MSSGLQQCMGGWCSCREKCGHYWAPKQPGVPPAERLCTMDSDGEAMTLRPIELQRPQQPEVMEP
jgi:hypothetical protein